MSDEGKRQLAETDALKAIANRESCPVGELQSACRIFDGALPLLVARYAATLRV